MAVLAVQQITLAGLSPGSVAANAGGDEVPLSGAPTWVEVTNGGGSSVTVTVDSKVPSSYGDDVNVAVAVPAGQSRRIGPLNPARFAAADGNADVSYSGVTSVTVAAFRI